jgi:hypothetical protein
MQRLLAELRTSERQVSAPPSADAQELAKLSTPEMVYYVLRKFPSGLSGSAIIEGINRLRGDVEEDNIRSAIYRESTKVSGRLARKGPKGEYIYFLKEAQKR